MTKTNKVNKTSGFFSIPRAILILLGSSLVLTLSLAFNELFKDLKEEYDTFSSKIVAHIIYISIIFLSIFLILYCLKIMGYKIDITNLY